jgi:hypothetical protein
LSGAAVARPTTGLKQSTHSIATERTAMHGDFAFDFNAPEDLAHASQGVTTLSSWGQCVNPTVSKSNQPCIICGKVNRNVELSSKQSRLLATFCQEHLYDRLPDRKQTKARTTSQQRVTKGKDA